MIGGVFGFAIALISGAVRRNFARAGRWLD
jgi:hypothetical protein